MIYNGKYLDPLVIFSFKKMFVDNNDKELLIAFLNEVFKGNKNIVDVVYNDIEDIEEMICPGEAIIDLNCTCDNGQQFFVELQVGKHESFEERAIFHAYRLVQEQKTTGTSDDKEGVLKEVYVIALVEDYIEGTPSKEYVHRVYFGHKNKEVIPYEGSNVIFIELPKFKKTVDKLETGLDKWVFAIKNMCSLNEVPASMDDPIFKKLFDIAEYGKLTDEEKEAYQKSLEFKISHQHEVDLELDKIKKEKAHGHFSILIRMKSNDSLDEKAFGINETLFAILKKENVSS